MDRDRRQRIDGDLARKNVKLVLQLDSTALDELVHARPFKAVNHAMKARDYLSVAKRLVSAP